MVTGTVMSTGYVVIVKSAETLPSGTVNMVGTDAFPGELLPRLMGIPPGGAGAVSTTVPETGLVPHILSEANFRAERVAMGLTVRNAELLMTDRPLLDTRTDR